MINLLDVETKRNIRAARLNIVLRRYVWAIIATFLFMALCFGVGYYVTLKDRDSAQRQLDVSKQEVARYAKVQKESAEFARNLTTAKAVLSSEIVFSDLVVNIAKTLPEGAVLSSLTIGAENIGSETSITARTVDDNETPLKLKQALEDSPIFDNVSIANITSPNNSAEAAPSSSSTAENAIMRAHPITVNLKATLMKPVAKKEVRP